MPRPQKKQPCAKCLNGAVLSPDTTSDFTVWGLASTGYTRAEMREAGFDVGPGKDFHTIPARLLLKHCRMRAERPGYLPGFPKRGTQKVQLEWLIQEGLVCWCEACGGTGKRYAYAVIEEALRNA